MITELTNLLTKITELSSNMVFTDKIQKFEKKLLDLE